MIQSSSQDIFLSLFRHSSPGYIIFQEAFYPRLKKQPVGFYKPLLRDYKKLRLYYRLLCFELIQDINAYPLDNPARLKEQKDKLLLGFMMAFILAHLAQQYLQSPRLARQWQKDQQRYQKWLKSLTNERFILPKTPLLSFEEELKRRINPCLWPRLVTLRLWRVFTTSIPLANESNDYTAVIQYLHHWLHPALTYSGWLFHGGRVLLNLVHITQHLVPGEWMSKEEQELGWLMRFETQFQQHWVEMVNDGIWMTSTLAPATLWLTVSLAFIESAMALLQAYLEIRRLMAVQCEWDSAMKNEASPDCQMATRHQHYFKACITHEQKKLLLRLCSLASVTALTVFKIGLPLLLPALAVNPVIPLVIAILIVGITVASHFLSQWLEQQKPVDSLEKLAAFEGKGKSDALKEVGFFARKNCIQSLEHSHNRKQGASIDASNEYGLSF